MTTGVRGGSRPPRTHRLRSAFPDVTTDRVSAARIDGKPTRCEPEVMVGLRDEEQQLTEVVGRLVVRHPSLSAATVAEVVQELYGKFNGARIREFVPLFVERHAERP